MTHNLVEDTVLNGWQMKDLVTQLWISCYTPYDFGESSRITIHWQCGWSHKLRADVYDRRLQVSQPYMCMIGRRESGGTGLLGLRDMMSIFAFTMSAPLSDFISTIWPSFGTSIYICIYIFGFIPPNRIPSAYYIQEDSPRSPDFNNHIPIPLSSLSFSFHL